MTFGSDPDIEVRDAQGSVQVVVEIKGGLDTAGIHERYGAASKTFEKAKRDFPGCETILIVRQSALTEGATQKIDQNPNVTQWFHIENLITKDSIWLQFLMALHIKPDSEVEDAGDTGTSHR